MTGVNYLIKAPGQRTTRRMNSSEVPRGVSGDVPAGVPGHRLASNG